MIDIEELDDRFSLEGELGFYEGEGDLIYISVFNKWADAEICLYGAQVTNFTPYGSFDVLWMSPASDFEVGKPIRGGIPVCFPWFGPHENDPEKPLHGFARLMYWDIVETAAKENGETIIKLQLESSSETRIYWPYEFKAEMSITIGKELDVRLKVTNTGNGPLEYTSALHSYFGLSEIKNIYISGLQGKKYYQGFGNELNFQEEEHIRIHKEENRRYIDTDGKCTILDPEFMREIHVSKEGSNVTVVWNPWEETCAKMSDLPDDGFQSFVCVEAVNSYNDKIILNPQGHHTTATKIWTEFKKGDLNLGAQNAGFSVTPF